MRSRLPIGPYSRAMPGPYGGPRGKGGRGGWRETLVVEIWVWRVMRQPAGQGRPRESLPRRSLRRGRQNSIFPQGKWFSNVKSANIGASEGFYPRHHPGGV